MSIKNIIVSLCIIASLLGNSTKVIAEPTYIVIPSELSLEGQVNYYSGVFQTDANLVKRVIECESKWNVNAVGDNGLSNGIAQFQKASFNRLSKLMGETLDYNSPHDQIKLLVWCIKNGHGREWTAYRAIQNGGTYSFYSKQLGKSFTVVCK
jgi:hypothetical protein